MSDKKYAYIPKGRPKDFIVGIELEMSFIEIDKFSWQTIENYLNNMGFYVDSYETMGIGGTTNIHAHKLVTDKSIVKETPQVMKDIRRLARDKESYLILNTNILIKLFY